MPPQDLFARAAAQDLRHQPLAERMRPQALAEVVGQPHLVGPKGTLTRLVQQKTPLSCVFWGPPGTGKTTLVKLLAQAFTGELVTLSAVNAGVKDVRDVVVAAEQRHNYHRGRTLLFVDEIHRFHRGQQDALLPHVERGTITFFGATTENPAFALNRALMSRCRMFVLEPLGPQVVADLLAQALGHKERGLGGLDLTAERSVLVAMAEVAEGDARRALGLLELTAQVAQAQGAKVIELAHLAEAHDVRVLAHDRAGDGHYDLASALIKSLRSSDAEAAVYYLARMLEAGEAPAFVARRLVIFASEDVGNACPEALQVAVAAATAHDRLGMPEATLPLTQATLFLAHAKKSRQAVDAYAHAKGRVEQHGSLAPPKHLLNATNAWRREAGYGDHGAAAAGTSCLPEALQPK